jgi:hypothetical protein
MRASSPLERRLLQLLVSAALSLGFARSAAAQVDPSAPPPATAAASAPVASSNATTTLPAPPSEQKMEEYRPIRWGYFAFGAASFGVGYIPLCAATRDERCIPIVGAGIWLDQLWNPDEDPAARDGVVPSRFLAIFAVDAIILQTLGAALLTYSFLGPTKVRVVSGWRVTPVLTADAVALTAWGTF